MCQNDFGDIMKRKISLDRISNFDINGNCNSTANESDIKELLEKLKEQKAINEENKKYYKQIKEKEIKLKAYIKYLNQKIKVIEEDVAKKEQKKKEEREKSNYENECKQTLVNKRRTQSVAYRHRGIKRR